MKTVNKHTRGLLGGRGNRITAFHPFQNYRIGIFKILKRVYAECGMSEQASLSLNSILLNIVNIIIEKLNRLCHVTGVKTIGSRHVQNATRLLVEGDLLHMCTSAGVKAVTKYSQNIMNIKKGKRLDRSRRAGLALKVSVTEKLLREHTQYRITAGSVVYFTGVLESIMEEILTLATHVAVSKKHIRVTSQDVFLGINTDNSDLKKLMHDCDIVLDSNNVQPHIYRQLLNKH